MSDYRITFHCAPQYKNEVWPKHFSESLLPRLDEMVMSDSGAILYVISIVHSEVSDGPDATPSIHLVKIILDSSRRPQ